MTIAVVVPLALNGCEYRQRAWVWVQDQYRAHFPDWELVTGTTEGPWSKGAAVADALTRTDADILVIADADVWADNLTDAVETVQSGTKEWSTPHGKVFRFNEPASRTICDGAAPVDTAMRSGTIEQMHTGMSGGGLVAVTRDLYEQCPLDPRFVGWGGEDRAWSYALSTLGGRRKEHNGILWHLWHPPQPRMNRKEGNPANERLRDRYHQAAGDGAATRTLIEEGRRCRSRTSTSRP